MNVVEFRVGKPAHPRLNYPSNGIDPAQNRMKKSQVSFEIQFTPDPGSDM